MKINQITEYGDTAKGQKMLTKVQKRAVDRMIKADDKRDAKNAKKNQDTANRAWDRMTDLDEQGIAVEGIEGEIAGGAIGGLVGGAAGSQLGPIGGALGSAVGSSVGSAIGSRYQDGKPLKEKQQLDEIAPLLAVGARLFMSAAPKIAQVIGKTGRAGAEITAKNAHKIGLGAGAYEIGSSVADIAKDITSEVGKAVDEKTVVELATLAFKYAIPAGIVLAILYGGKKAIDSLFSDRKEKLDMAEGLNEMDKSAPQPGRDGKVSHSTYGSRDKKGSDYFKGKEAPGKPITKKQMEKDVLDILKKQGVAEGSLEEVDRRGFLKGMGAAAAAGVGLAPTPAKAWFFFIIPLPNMKPDAAANACMPPGVQVGQRVKLDGKLMVVQKIHGVSNRCQDPNRPVAATLVEPDTSQTQAPIVQQPPNQSTTLTYGQKLIAAIKPNIIFKGEVEGNPTTEVEVKTSSDGTINSVRIIKQSDNADWDKAVFKAIVRTEKLPLDIDGNIPPTFVFSFRPKDIPQNESAEQGVAESKPKEKEADYGPDYQDMVARVKKLAGLGPLKTVWDPQKRVYKNVPRAEQPKK